MRRESLAHAELDDRLGVIGGECAQHRPDWGELAPDVHAERRLLNYRLDVWGAVTATGGVSLLIYACTQAEHAGWASVQTLVLLAASVALLAAFVVVERRSAKPLLPFRIFSIRALSVANVAMVAFAAGVYAMMFFLSLYLQQVLGYTPLQAGLAYIPLALGLFFGPLGGQLLTRFGPHSTMITGLALATAGMAWFTQISAEGTFLMNVLGPSLLIAAGGQFAVVGTTTFAIGGVSQGEQGIVSGVFNTSREIGGALGVGVLAAVAAAQTISGANTAGSRAAALSEGYQAGVLGAFVLVFVALALAVALLPRTQSESIDVEA